MHEPVTTASMKIRLVELRPASPGLTCPASLGRAPDEYTRHKSRELEKIKRISKLR